ncbi:MAG: NUDIX domain-containing protein [Chloroflexota bacterium]
MSDYHESYLGQLRQLIGKKKIFAIGARAIITNDKGHVLLVQRSDNQQWVMPAGSVELEESILDTCKREVWEETGLIVHEATLIAIYSDPSYSFVTAYGDPYQMLSFVFRVDSWSGELLNTTDETLAAKFFALDALPDNIPSIYEETLDDLKNSTEQLSSSDYELKP